MTYLSLDECNSEINVIYYTFHIWKQNVFLTDCKGLSSVINRLSSFKGKYYKAVIEYD